MQQDPEKRAQVIANHAYKTEMLQSARFKVQYFAAIVIQTNNHTIFYRRMLMDHQNFKEIIINSNWYY